MLRLWAMIIFLCSSGLTFHEQPSLPESYLRAARLFHSGNYTQAEAELKEALRTQPESPEAAYLMGRLCAVKDRPREAEVWVQKSLASKPDLVEAWEFLGVLYCEQKQFASARGALLRALELKPDNSFARLHLGIAREGLNDNEGAMSAYEQAMQIGEQSPHVRSRARTNLGLLHVKLATVYSEGNRLTEATRELEKARDLLPPSHELLALLGAAYLKANDPRAVQTLRQAAELNPTEDAWEKLAQTLSAHHKLDEAVEIFTAKVSENPNSELFRRLLGAAYWDRAEYPAALEEYRQIVTQNPDSAQAHYLVGSAQRLLGNTSAAQNSLSTALRLDPDLVPANIAMADSLSGQGKNQEAVRFLEKAVQKKPEDTAIQIKLAQLYLDLKRSEDALKMLKAAERQGPNQKKLHYLLGRAYAATGRPDLAQKEFSTFKALEATELESKQSK
jgi:tetratricopeptide (TPR) repeat protein